MFIIFIGGGGLTIFLNVVTELPHKRSLPIYRRLSRRVTGVLLKIIPIVYGMPFVILFRDLGLAVDYCLFPQAFNFDRVPLCCTQRGKEYVICLLNQLDIH